MKSFNTQPPEGGWPKIRKRLTTIRGFNTQPPEGGWQSGDTIRVHKNVSTHSRLKAAGL